MYRGYRIPANTMVIPNTWAMLHNEETYPDSFAFKPERFLPGPHGDPEQFPHASFGFGRRSVVLSSDAVPQPL